MAVGTPAADAELHRAVVEMLRDEAEVLGVIAFSMTSGVFRARRRADGADVVIKVLRPEVTGGTIGERFLREIEIEGRLRHPNIVSVIGWGRREGLVYCVMPFTPGDTLRQRLEREGQLPLEEAARITSEIARALEHAHANGIVHRDVKPANVLLTVDGVRLLDFGIARALSQAAGERLTESGVTLGTPSYMSPEQAAGDHRIDARTDEYSLACVAHEMLTGEVPFSGRSSQAIIARHLGEAPPSARIVRKAVPEATARVLLRALEKSPADRFPTCAEFAGALTASLTDPGIAPAPARRLRRARYVALAVAGVVVATVALWPRPGALDASRVVIFPLADARATTASDAGWSTAIAIEASLEHAEPFRGLALWNELSEAARTRPRELPGADALRTARRLGARYFVTGVVIDVADSVAVSLRLYDAERDSLLGHETATGAGVPAPLAQLGIRAVRALLPKMLAGDRTVEPEVFERRSPAAIALWLQGETSYRRSDFAKALELLERSVGEDSLLAVAAIRGAQAASWITNLQRAGRLLAVAEQRRKLLPLRYSGFIDGLRAYLRGDADSAARLLSRAAAADPDWVEPRMALGEVYYHLFPAVDAPDSLARVTFETVARSHPTFTPALAHLVEEAIREGDLPQADRLLAQMRVVRRGAEPPADLVIMRSCVGAPRSVHLQDWMADSGAAMLAAGHQLAVGARQLDCASAAFRMVLANPNARAGIRWGALMGVQGVLTSEGRFAEAGALLDSVARAGLPQARLLAGVALASGGPFGPTMTEFAAFARTQFGDDFERALPQTKWILALWRASAGDSAELTRLTQSVERAAAKAPARKTALIARALAAHVSLARHDSAAAVTGLRALRVSATRDSLQWELFEPLAVERLALARLLAARGRHAEAFKVARTFDQAEPMINVQFVAESLRLRVVSARALGWNQAVKQAEDRLEKIAAFAKAAGQ